ncbi:Uncharacterized protein PECH_002616 [Penicillium ucsense]|uniref:Uncharacterized protein n=1 Tax=Penicillium ucsense TaxID=2839758 RepID=A0A8J8VYI4_9EURO|nr:Uncharacterized protein PECM_002170 [Penicillium ucsense]KAF7730624.1 Uncharacterized protein PECH_002616 [Penicillium ucsense]
MAGALNPAPRSSNYTTASSTGWLSVWRPWLGSNPHSCLDPDADSDLTTGFNTRSACRLDSGVSSCWALGYDDDLDPALQSRSNSGLARYSNHDVNQRLSPDSDSSLRRSNSDVNNSLASALDPGVIMVRVQKQTFELPMMSEESFQQTTTFSDNVSARSNEGWLEASRPDAMSRGGILLIWAEEKDKQQGYDSTQADASRFRAHREDSRPVDSAAVVSLLTDTSFDPAFGGTEEMDLDPAAASSLLTRSEMEMLNSFRKQIGRSSDRASTTASSQAGLSGLSLIPDIDSFLQQNDPSTLRRQGMQATAQPSLTLSDSVLKHLRGAVDWVTVHERYHDEIWGYLRPALEPAKEEMEEKGQEGLTGEEDTDGPAFRRLKVNLRHMQV